jgi:hypothetical protein
MKRCNDCGLEKPLSKFHKKSDNKDGLNNFCSPCCSIRQAKNRARLRVNNGTNAASKHKVGGPYKVVYCPCDSFTRNSSFTRAAIRKMLKDEFLFVGTRFRRGKITWEVSSKNTLLEVTA